MTAIEESPPRRSTRQMSLPAVAIFAGASPPQWLRSRGELLLAALLAALSSAALLSLRLPTGDGPAHAYRVWLVDSHALIWDNLWYGGQYPLASYSLLYYFPAALAGNIPLATGAAVLSAAVFASLATREWGRRARWGSRVFAVSRPRRC